MLAGVLELSEVLVSIKRHNHILIKMVGNFMFFLQLPFSWEFGIVLVCYSEKLTVL